jgi:hypothetical protein
VPEQVNASTVLPEPYKGIESYRTEDADIYFGRFEEGDLVAAKIQSSRFMVLHAQSGAGKTSLLNAKVLPCLEARGVFPVTIRLQHDPVESVRTAVLLTLLPPPSLELATLDLLCKVAEFAPDQVTIRQALDYFDNLPVYDSRRSMIIESQLCDIAIPGAVTRVVGESTSLFARLLRAVVEVKRYGAHLESIARQCSSLSSTFEPITLDTHLSTLIHILNGEDYRKAYDKVLGALYLPQPELTAFFRQLSEVYGPQFPGFCIVLIFDQFEELFTLFPATLVSGAKSEAHSKYQLRIDFISQLGDLYRAATQATPSAADDAVDQDRSGTLPLRFALSMRDEYIAQLDPVSVFVPAPLDLYHLNLLNGEQARDAILRPAEIFGFKYSRECLTEIVKDLTKEDGLIEPAHLSLVCERLWQVSGKKLSQESLELPAGSAVVRKEGTTDSADAPEEQQVSVDTFNNLGRVPGILSAYFTGLLDVMPKHEQLETLEILEPLVTTSRTRNIVEMDVLIHPIYRNAKLREMLFNRLVDAKVIRVERRLRSNFVEILHEFLIDTILKEIQLRLLSDVGQSRFRAALTDLRASSSSPFRATLDRNSFDTLHQRRSEIVWDESAIEVMARSSIELGMPRDVCGLWLRQVNVPSPESLEQLLANVPAGAEPLAIGDMTAILAVSNIDSLRLEAKLVVLRSLLYWTEASQRDNIRSWIREAHLDV